MCAKQRQAARLTHKIPAAEQAVKAEDGVERAATEKVKAEEIEKEKHAQVEQGGNGC